MLEVRFGQDFVQINYDNSVSLFCGYVYCVILCDVYGIVFVCIDEFHVRSSVVLFL